MLFAFVACDNSGSNANPASIAYVEATLNSGVVYVKGEKVDAADFTFKGYDVLGNEIATIPSERFTSDVQTSLEAGKQDVTFSYGNFTTESVEIDAKEVTGITVDATNALKEYYGVVANYSYDDEDRKTIDISGLVVTAAYDGGSKVVDNDLVSISYEKDGSSATLDWGDTTPVAKPTSYDVVVTFAGESDDYAIQILPNYVERVEMKATEGYSIYYKEAKDLETAKLAYATVDPSTNAVTGDGVYMVLYYQGLEEFAVASDTSIGFLDSLGGYTQKLSNIEISVNGAVLNAQYKTIANCAEGSDRVASTFSVDSVENVVESIVLKEYPASIKIGDYTETPPTGDFKFIANWTDDTEKDTLITGTKTASEVELAYNDADNEAENWWVLGEMDLTAYEEGRTTLSVEVCYEGVTESFEFPVLLTK